MAIKAYLVERASATMGCKCTKISNKPPIKACKPMETPYLTHEAKQRKYPSKHGFNNSEELILSNVPCNLKSSLQKLLMTNESLSLTIDLGVPCNHMISLANSSVTVLADLVIKSREISSQIWSGIGSGCSSPLRFVATYFLLYIPSLRRVPRNKTLELPQNWPAVVLVEKMLPEVYRPSLPRVPRNKTSELACDFTRQNALTSVAVASESNYPKHQWRGIAGTKVGVAQQQDAGSKHSHHGHSCDKSDTGYGNKRDYILEEALHEWHLDGLDEILVFDGQENIKNGLNSCKINFHVQVDEILHSFENEKACEFLPDLPGVNAANNPR
ncbi:hypothetical protein CR513_23203, partial [Mucuna pruriens]